MTSGNVFSRCIQGAKIGVGLLDRLQAHLSLAALGQRPVNAGHARVGPLFA